MKSFYPIGILRLVVFLGSIVPFVAALPIISFDPSSVTMPISLRGHAYNRRPAEAVRVQGLGPASSDPDPERRVGGDGRSPLGRVARFQIAQRRAVDSPSMAGTEGPKAREEGFDAGKILLSHQELAPPARSTSSPTVSPTPILATVPAPQSAPIPPFHGAQSKKGTPKHTTMGQKHGGHKAKTQFMGVE